MASILDQFWQIRMHFRAENLLFPTMYNSWGSMVIYLWIARNNDQICDSGLFLQNALVEYIGVYSDTNKLTGEVSKKKYFSAVSGGHYHSMFVLKRNQFVAEDKLLQVLIWKDWGSQLKLLCKFCSLQKASL